MLESLAKLCNILGMRAVIGLNYRYFLGKFVKFCRASDLQNTTYYSATASDFQQHFCLAFFPCFISNISIRSQLVA